MCTRSRMCTSMRARWHQRPRQCAHTPSSEQTYGQATTCKQNNKTASNVGLQRVRSPSRHKLLLAGWLLGPPWCYQRPWKIRAAAGARCALGAGGSWQRGLSGRTACHENQRVHAHGNIDRVRRAVARTVANISTESTSNPYAAECPLCNFRRSRPGQPEAQDWPGQDRCKRVPGARRQ